MPKIYFGHRRSDFDLEVTVDDKPLKWRNDLMNHSPDGLNWGYSGSGAAQLAIAILADCVGDETAIKHYIQFKNEVIAHLPKAQWFLSEEAVNKIVEVMEMTAAK